VADFGGAYTVTYKHNRTSMLFFYCALAPTHYAWDVLRAIASYVELPFADHGLNCR
jgi:hypothetical protein